MRGSPPTIVFYATTVAAWASPAAMLPTSPLARRGRIFNPSLTLFTPDANAEQIRWFTEMQRVSATPEAAVGLMMGLPSIDVRDLLPQLKMPTLVIHRRGDGAVPFEFGRELAALIPST